MRYNDAGKPQNYVNGGTHFYNGMLITNMINYPYNL